MAVLDVIEQEALMQNAAIVGEHLREGLEALGRINPLIGQVRGAGFFIGADIVRDGHPVGDEAARIVNGLRARRVLISASGPRGNVLKIRPPLPFTLENADLFLNRLDQVLAEL